MLTRKSPNAASEGYRDMPEGSQAAGRTLTTLPGCPAPAFIKDIC